MGAPGWRVAACAAALALLAPSASRAHVGPSSERNNRYLTLAPEPGGVRFVYTLIFGDRPGAAARERMDRDGDGMLSESEKRAFADSIGQAIRGGLDVELGDEPVSVNWRRIDLAIGRASAEGGAFSIDLRARFCFDVDAEQVLRLVDAFRIPPVGEGALRLEPSGVKIRRSAMGDAGGTRRSFKWMGKGAIAEQGYLLELRVPDSAEGALDCSESEVGGARQRGGREAASAREGGDPVASDRSGEGAGASSGSPGRAAVIASMLAAVCVVLILVGAVRRR